MLIVLTCGGHVVRHDLSRFGNRENNISIYIIIIIVVIVRLRVLTCCGHVVGHDLAGHQTLGVLGGGDDGEQATFAEILHVDGWDLLPYSTQL